MLGAAEASDESDDLGLLAGTGGDDDDAEAKAGGGGGGPATMEAQKVCTRHKLRPTASISVRNWHLERITAVLYREKVAPRSSIGRHYAVLLVHMSSAIFLLP